jgi:hypothetical protein
MSGGLLEAVQRTADCAFRNVAESGDEEGEDNVAVPAQEKEDIRWRLTRPSFLSNYSRTHSPLCGAPLDEKATVRNFLAGKILKSHEPSAIDVQSLNWYLDTIHRTEEDDRLFPNLQPLPAD